MSPPTRGRGLKLGGGDDIDDYIPPSPPTRGRGLKQIGLFGDAQVTESPPTRGRGLKRELGAGVA